MQLFALALVVGIFLHDLAITSGTVAPNHFDKSTLGMLLLAALTTVAVFHMLCRRAARHPSLSSLRRIDQAWSAYRVIILLLFGTALRSGALRLIRSNMGDWVLIDELIVLACPIAMLVAAYAAHYIIEKRLYEASLIRRIDSGLPLNPMASPARFIILRLRSELGLALGPLLVIMTWLEFVTWAIPTDLYAYGMPISNTMQWFGAVIIFLISPMLIRRLWDTVPMPDGVIRQHITAMCQTHRIPMRECLLWRTQTDGSTGTSNAAVMGLIGRFRYLLITDALIQRMPTHEVQAVIAHELGHVRRQHLFWLLIAGITLLLASEIITQRLFDTWPSTQSINTIAITDPITADTNTNTNTNTNTSINTATITALVLWVLAFGWVSRRFERQADTFAVQHFSHDDLIDAQATQTMRSALMRVAHLNHMNPRKRSWRHGSIQWRCNYLDTLVGRDPNNLPIDQLVKRIKIVTAIAMILFIASELFALL